MLLAPFDDESWEIWTINNSAYKEQIPRWTRQFELHPIHWTQEAEYEGYYDWLTQQEKPIYLQAAVPEIQSGVVYPLEQIRRHFDGPGADYFTNSIAYMIALAIYELDMERKEAGIPDNPSDNAIGLWGVNMAQHGVGGKSEYAAQRPSCEFWCGIIRGRGYTFVLPDESDLLHTGCLYGFDQGGAIWDKVRARDKELQDRIARAQSLEQRSHDESVFLQGALEGQQYFKQWLSLQEEVGE